MSPFTVLRELGHGSRAMVEEVYAHLGTMRHRSEAVEYRIEQHAEALADRLARLSSVTSIVTTAADGVGHEKPRNREAETGSNVTPSGRRDSNPGPPAPKAGALPDCATPRTSFTTRFRPAHEDVQHSGLVRLLVATRISPRRPRREWAPVLRQRPPLGPWEGLRHPAASRTVWLRRSWR